MSVVKILQKLIQFNTITPADNGCMKFISGYLQNLGFMITPLNFIDDKGQEIRNLYARIGQNSPNICFAGHVDVVPVTGNWTYPPFEGKIINNNIYGRGAVDMKGAIAAFLSILPDVLTTHKASISLLLTGDEEGPATHGTQKVIEYLLKKNEQIDLCIVGEPTSVNYVGDCLKIGRRGSLNGTLTVHGDSGHVAYPHNANNPIPTMLRLLNVLEQIEFNDKTEQFDASNLEITSVDVGNPTENVIPGSISSRFNIRYTPKYTKESLIKYIGDLLLSTDAKNFSVTWKGNAEAFLASASPYSNFMQEAVKLVTGKSPTLSTSGGTSDARFITHLCPVIECGLLNATAHKVDEYVSIDDLENLSTIYKIFFSALSREPTNTHM